MRNFQEKSKLRHIMQSKPVLVLLGIIILIFAWSIIQLIGKAGETAKNRKIAEDKIIELHKGKEKLSSDIAKLNTDSGIEENIREKFGLAKEGKSMIVIVEDKNLSEKEKIKLDSIRARRCGGIRLSLPSDGSPLSQLDQGEC